MYDLADAAVAAAGKGASSSSSGFLSPLTDTLETVLKTIQTQLNRLNVPYSYGYSIILLTVMVKMLTLPLTKIQVRVLSHYRAARLAACHQDRLQETHLTCSPRSACRSCHELKPRWTSTNHL